MKKIIFAVKGILKCLLSVFLTVSVLTPVFAAGHPKPIITASEPDVYIRIGESKQLTYHAMPDEYDWPVTWSVLSDPSDTVKVDENGVVSNTLRPTHAVIKSAVPGGEYALYHIYVYEDANQLNASQTRIYMNRNETRRVLLNAVPAGGIFAPKTASAGDPDLVSVNSGTFGGEYLELNSMNKTGQTDVIVRTDKGIYAVLSVYVTDDVIASSMSSNLGKNVYLKPSKSTTLNYSLYPSNATDEVSYDLIYDSNQCISLLEEDGTLWASKNCGQARAIAQGYRTSYDWNIFVAEDPASLSVNDVTVPLYETVWVPFNVSPSNALFCKKTIENSYMEVCTVNDNVSETGMNGVYIYGVAEGTVPVYVTTDNGITASFTVTVKDIKADYISSDQTDLTLELGDSMTLPYTLSPSDATEIPTIGIEDNPDVVEIDYFAGLITGKTQGTAELYMDISSGDRQYYRIHVFEDPYYIAFEQESYEFESQTDAELTLITEPAGGAYGHFTVTSSNDEIVEAETDQYGAIKIRTWGRGTAVLTARADNGLTCSTEITVTKPGAENIFNNDDDPVRMKPNSTHQLSYYLQPVLADEMPVFEVVNGEALFKVDEMGLVTSFDQCGTGVISASIENGKKIYYNINVEEDAEGIDFDQGFYRFELDSHFDFTHHLLFSPYGAYYGEYTLTSSDPSVLKVIQMSGRAYIEALKTGTVTLTLSAENISKSVNATVLSGYASEVTSSDPRIIHITKGKTRYLDASVSNSEGNTNRDRLRWFVTKGNDLVEIDDMGMMETKEYGIAEVEARTELFGNEVNDQGYRYRRSFEIRVTEEPVSLAFPEESYTLPLHANGQLCAYADRPEADYYHRIYQSSDNSILSIDERGWYNARKTGTVNVTCTADNGVSVTVPVTVTNGDYPYLYALRDYSLRYLYEGESVNLNELIIREDGKPMTEADYNGLEWRSMDPSVISIDNGVLKAAKSGLAEITLTSKDSLTLHTYLQLIVTKPETSVHFKKAEYNLLAGKEMNLLSEFETEPSDTVLKDVTFTSSDPKIASLARNGNQWHLYANRSGTVTIKAETDSGHHAEMKLNVGKRETVTEMDLFESTVSLHVNYRYAPDFVSMNPVFTDSTRYTMTSSDPSVARVIYIPYSEYGQEILGVSEGSATITVRANEDPTLLSKTFTVNVTKGDSDHYQFAETLIALEGKTHHYAAYASNQDVYTVYTGKDYLLSTWGLWIPQRGVEHPGEIVNPTLAYHDPDHCISELVLTHGVPLMNTEFEEYHGSLSFTALRKGTFTVNTIGNRTVTFNVIDEPETILPSSIAIEGEAEVEYGKTVKLNAIVKPDEAENKSVTWISLDPEIVSVDQDGTVHGLSIGTGKVRAETVNGLTAECEVRVLFNDAADDGKYFFEPVYWAADHQITVGHGGAGKFSPDASCTREQIVTFLWRLMGEPQAESHPEFTDVKETDWYYEPISWAASKGITLGLNDGTGRFGVGQPCTREQCVTFLYRTAEQPEVGEHEEFTDVAAGRYFYDSISWAASKGITLGLNDGTGRFGVGQKCTRAMIVTFLYRFAHTD